MNLPEKPDTYIYAGMRPAAYFTIAPPLRMNGFGPPQIGPLEVSPDETAWVNEVLGKICEEVAPGGWVRTDEVQQIAAMLENVFQVHLRDDLLRENFPKIGWRREEGGQMVPHFTERKHP